MKKQLHSRENTTKSRDLPRSIQQGCDALLTSLTDARSGLAVAVVVFDPEDPDGGELFYSVTATSNSLNTAKAFNGAVKLLKQAEAI